MIWLLLVTWFVQGQSPSSYQVEFASAALCGSAKSELQADADRRRMEFENTLKQHADPKTGLPLIRVPQPPNLSVICVQKN